MAGLPEVIGLLYRADWTRLSLSAEVRFEQAGTWPAAGKRGPGGVDAADGVPRLAGHAGRGAGAGRRARTSITGGTRPC